MVELYSENTANYPRLQTDRFFADYENHYHFDGTIAETFRFIENHQLLRPELWHRFALQFGTGADNDLGWRGEYWGKMMRGASFVWSCTEDPELYQILTDSVREMLTREEASGRFSSYDEAHEFKKWDLWCRKYVLLGMQYYLEICKDPELARRVVDSMRHQVDYIMSKIGGGEGQTPINEATGNWRGLNSSSILEPVVRLYNLTKEQKYLDFAGYIVGEGGTSIENIFELAWEDKLLPYQYPTTKAYEMTSCFEGLLEYYRITGVEKYKEAVIRYGNRILESDFTVIGSAGCTHELFDHSAVRQANTTNGPTMQETCVTVTLMKFFTQLLLLTGDSRYADAFERSFYNGYLGSLNTEQIALSRSPYAVEHFRQASEWTVEPLPFDSYSPLTAGTRGTGIGGLQRMADDHYYGCCACIASAGAGLLSKNLVCRTADGLAVSLFMNSTVETRTPSGNPVELQIITDYPRSGLVKIRVRTEKPENFTLLIRDPGFSRRTLFALGDMPAEALSEIPEAFKNKGYLAVNQTWEDDFVTLLFDMRVFARRPISYGHDILMNKIIWKYDVAVPVYDEEDPLAKHHVCLERGPLVYAQDARLGIDVDVPVDIPINEDGTVEAVLKDPSDVPFECISALTVTLSDGKQMDLSDYSSAGKTWDLDSKMAAWILTE